jgi:hypothetical protein
MQLVNYFPFRTVMVLTYLILIRRHFITGFQYICCAIFTTNREKTNNKTNIDELTTYLLKIKSVPEKSHIGSKQRND